MCVHLQCTCSTVSVLLAVNWQFLNIRTNLIDFRKVDRGAIFQENTEKYGRLAALHDVTPIITFDQPLWWKSLIIICHWASWKQSEKCDCPPGYFFKYWNGFSWLYWPPYGSIRFAEIAGVDLCLQYSGACANRQRYCSSSPRPFIIDAALSVLILTNIFTVPIPASDKETEEFMETT